MPEVLTTIACSTCGATTPAPPPPSWSPAVEGGRRVWTCPDCARENIRSIESRVSPPWW